jgi:small GTP-binding protein
MKSLKNILFGKEFGIEKQIAFVGLFNAGKTTLVKRIKGEDNIDTKYFPTMGLSIEKFKIGSYEVAAADLGGHKSLQETFWKPFCKRSAAVVFVFDSADEKRVDEAGEAIKKVLGWINENCIFLFLANKMDLEQALSLEEIINKLKLKDIAKTSAHAFGIYQISALKQSNLEDPISWLSEQLTKYESTEDT